MQPGLHNSALPGGRIRGKGERPRSASVNRRDGDAQVAPVDLEFPHVDGYEIVPRPRYERLQWAVNAVISLIALVVLAPLMVAVAVAIRFTSPGPVIYKQTRIGLDRRWRHARRYDQRRSVDLGGKPFTMYKFRTMTVAPQGAAREVWAQKDDPRVTPIGRILRQYRIDELPQLINVLKGDMNIVGPRPEQPQIFAEMREGVSGYEVRQRVKPGLTGLAQIHHHYDTCVEDVRKKVQYDLRYLQCQCLPEDLRIMAKTLPVILFRRGAH